MPFLFDSLEIPEVVVIEAKSFDDHRGYFMETYKSSEFTSNGIGDRFVQDNYSHSHRGVFRGLHYQNPPSAQAKLVKVFRGEILDVAVDIRDGSPTYGKFVTASLSDKNGLMLFVPAGFAHGFCTLSDEADVLYKVTAEYAPECDRGIRWDDPAIGLELPIEEVILSEKDERMPLLADADNGFVYEGEGR